MTLPSKRVSALDARAVISSDTTGDGGLGREMMPAHLEAARGVTVEVMEIAVGERQRSGRVRVDRRETSGAS